LIVAPGFVIVVERDEREGKAPEGVDEEDFMDFTATTVIIADKMNTCLGNDQRGSRKYLTSQRKQGPTWTHAQTTPADT
jgi:uncharacterized protein YhjY with autotransporter beta-barrel domain